MSISNLQAEKSILIGLINHGKDGFIEVDDVIRPEDFENETHKIVFSCCKEYYDKYNNNVDIPSIISTATDLGYKNYLSKDVLAYIKSLKDESIELNNIRNEAIKVAKLSITRKLKQQMVIASKELEKIVGTESIAEIFAIPEGKILDLSNFLDRDTQQTKKIGTDGVEWIQHIIDNPRETIGISTGYPLFDASIGGGLRRGNTNLVVARAKAGKTTFVDNVAIHIADVLKIPVFNVDTEMTDKEHLARIYANMCNIDSKLIETGKLDAKQQKQVLAVAKKVADIPYYYRTVAGCSFDEILSIIKRWILKEVGIRADGTTNDCVVIYDYFKLMDTNELSKNMAEYQALGFQLQALNAFTKRYDFPCLSFGQTNRDGIREETIAVIASSDRLSQYATSVSLLKEKEPEEIAQDGKQNGNRKMKTLVTRFGPGTGHGYINFDFQGEYSKLIEIGLNSQNVSDEAFELEDNDEV